MKHNEIYTINQSNTPILSRSWDIYDPSAPITKIRKNMKDWQYRCDIRPLISAIANADDRDFEDYDDMPEDLKKSIIKAMEESNCKDQDFLDFIHDLQFNTPTVGEFDEWYLDLQDWANEDRTMWLGL